MDRLQDKLTNNTTNPFPIPNKLLRKPFQIPLLTHDPPAQSNMEKAFLLASTFSSYFSPNSIVPHISDLVNNHTTTPLFSSDPNFPPSLVASHISKINPTKSTGIDKVPGFAIKQLPIKPILILTKIYNACTALSYYPSSWKISLIKPSFSPYVHEHMSSHFNPSQFGFRPDHSTSHQLFRVTEHITTALYRGQSTGFAALDLEKVFDKVWHPGLLYKLCLYGFSSRITNLIRAYVSNRFFRVEVSGELFPPLPILSGVPQGSALGPILFTIYINDIPSPTDNRTLLALYADDTAFLSSSKNPQHCKHCLRHESRENPDEFFCRRIQFQCPEEWDSQILAKEQSEDPNFGLIFQWKISNTQRPSWQEVADKSPALKGYWALWDSLVIDNGLLKRVWESPDGKVKNYQTVLPQKRVPEVLQSLHGGIGGGHFGINKTLNKVRERFYWLGSRSDVEEWCRQCETCAGSKGPKTRSRGKMQQYNVGAPFERIAMDIAGPFPRSSSGNRYILVVMDYFSKWPEIYPIPNQEATTVAEALFENWICRYGVPREIHSDQGRNFESDVFQNLCRLLGISKTRTTPLHPQSDGMVERFNRTIENFLRTAVNEQQTNWDTCIPPFLLAYRSAVHESTGKSPASVVFGGDLRLPIDLLANRPGNQGSVDDYIGNLRHRIKIVHEEVRQKMKFESDRMKTRYDSRANNAGFNVDDQVWLYNPKRTKGKSPKLQKSWEGPYTVVARLNDVVYRIRKNSQSKMKIVHIDRLTPYRGRPPQEGIT